MGEPKRCLECSGKYLDNTKGCPHCEVAKKEVKKAVKK